MASIRSNGFRLAIGTTECWKCHQSTHVFALIAPHGSSATDDDYSSEDCAQVEDVHVDVALTGIEQVSDALRSCLATAAPLFYSDQSRTLGDTYWMNHCEKCGFSQGDHYLHMEPDGPFFAWPRNDVALTVLHVGGGEVVCSMPYLAPPPKARCTGR
jgi:hypothetical protein